MKLKQRPPAPETIDEITQLNAFYKGYLRPMILKEPIEAAATARLPLIADEEFRKLLHPDQNLTALPRIEQIAAESGSLALKDSVET